MVFMLNLHEPPLLPRYMQWNKSHYSFIGEALPSGIIQTSFVVRQELLTRSGIGKKFTIL